MGTEMLHKDAIDAMCRQGGLMSKRFGSLLWGAAAFAMLVMLPSNTSAQTCDFTSLLNSPNPALAPFLPASGSFGSVCIDLTSSTTATITFSANSGFLIGGAGAVDAEINSSSFTVSNISQSTLSIQNPPGVNNVDGQGSFNLILDNFDGFTSAFSTASFDITSATTFASAADVLTANNLGLDAAAHIFVCADPTCTNLAAGATLTGFSGESGGGSVPEPTSVALLGGIVLFVTSRLRKHLA